MSDQPAHAPLPPERHAHILEALGRDGAVRISQLSTELGVAPVTLRRDLAQLEDEGALQRIHGGAVPVSDASPDRPAPARSATRARGAIAVLVPSLGFYWTDVLNGMNAAAKAAGMWLLVRATSYQIQDERPVLTRLAATDGVRGLIAAPNSNTEHALDVVEWLREAPLPCVLVERTLRSPGRAPLESAGADHVLGTELAVHHLVGLGHRRIGLVVSHDSPHRAEIVSGWRRAHQNLRLDGESPLEWSLPSHTTPGFTAAVATTFDAVRAQGITGLLVHSDPEAMALIDHALDRGLTVPGDLSVVSYDDQIAALFTPPLTAVRPPREAIGAAAVELLVRRLEDPTRPVHRIVVSPTLNVRRTTARLRP